MPKYSIKDPTSGKTVTVEGPKPPTQADAEEIFQKAGLRKNSQDSSMLSRLGTGAVKNVKDLVGGLASIPGMYAIPGKDAVETTRQLAVGMGKGLVNEASQLLGTRSNEQAPLLDPSKSIFEKGGINVQGTDLNPQTAVPRAVNRAIDNPVNTILDILPFLPKAKLSGLSQTGKTKNGILVNTADVINSGGSKEYIARTAGKDGVIAQNKVLLDEGILGKPTETGRIKATQVSLDKVGSELEKLYTNSKQVINSGDLNNLLDTRLGEMGYPIQDINFIKAYVARQGKFDLNSGDIQITPLQTWDAARRLQKNPPKILKSPESAAQIRQLSTDTARIMRDILAEKIPKTVPSNAKYSALKDYMEYGLDNNPQGVALASRGTGIVGAIQSGAKSVINPILQGLYNNPLSNMPKPSLSGSVQSAGSGRLTPPQDTFIKSKQTPKKPTSYNPQMDALKRSLAATNGFNQNLF